MPETILRILGQEVRFDCAPGDVRRLEDLAAALEARLSGFSGDGEGLRRLTLTALALLDETQTSGAALARAHAEIERLNDLIAEAGVEIAAAPPAPSQELGRVAALASRI